MVWSKINEMKKVILTMVAAALATSGMAQSDCGELLDANQDGLIGVEDLMNLLSHFGDSDLDFDGVFDSVDMCLDISACNYSANPTEECTYLDLVGICGGDCTEDADGDGICDWTCGIGFLYQGHVYSTVEIDNQCWFAENLRATHYANGDEIPEALSPSEWSNTTQGAQAIYGNDTNNELDYGRLYNGFAVIDPRDVCPNSWHVPTTDDWNDLASALGGTMSAGHALKSSPDDSPPWDGSNSSGFFGSAGGLRWENGTYERIYQSGYWWNSDGIHDRRLYGGSSALGGTNNDIEMGFSIRCLKDAE